MSDIRWHQRLANFDNALAELNHAVVLSTERELSRLEEQGVIQAFEYNFELAWNCIKDFYQNQGEMTIQGSRDAFRMAFKRGLVDDGKLWMDMIQSRIMTSHTYNRETAKAVLADITQRFFMALTELNAALHQEKSSADNG